MKPAMITPKDEKVFQITGTVTVETVPALRDKGNQWLQSCEAAIFDFSSVTSSDSAALALLVSWRRTAQQTGKTLRFTHVSQPLVDIATVSGLTAVLGLDSPE